MTMLADITDPKLVEACWQAVSVLYEIQGQFSHSDCSKEDDASLCQAISALETILQNQPAFPLWLSEMSVGDIDPAIAEPVYIMKKFNCLVAFSKENRNELLFAEIGLDGEPVLTADGKIHWQVCTSAPAEMIRLVNKYFDKDEDPAAFDEKEVIDGGRIINCIDPVKPSGFDFECDSRKPSGMRP